MRRMVRSSLDCSSQVQNNEKVHLTRQVLGQRDKLKQDLVESEATINKLLAEIDKRDRIIEAAELHLNKIYEPMKYHHWEEEPYTRAGCFQFVAQEGLKAIQKLRGDQ